MLIKRPAQQGLKATSASISSTMLWLIPPRTDHNGFRIAVFYHQSVGFKGVVFDSAYQCQIIDLSNIHYGYDNKQEHVFDFLINIFTQPHLCWDLIFDQHQKKIKFCRI